MYTKSLEPENLFRCEFGVCWNRSKRVLCFPHHSVWLTSQWTASCNANQIITQHVDCHLVNLKWPETRPRFQIKRLWWFIKLTGILYTLTRSFDDIDTTVDTSLSLTQIRTLARSQLISSSDSTQNFTESREIVISKNSCDRCVGAQLSIFTKISRTLLKMKKCRQNTSDSVDLSRDLPILFCCSTRLRLFSLP